MALKPGKMKKAKRKNEGEKNTCSIARRRLDLRRSPMSSDERGGVIPALFFYAVLYARQQTTITSTAAATSNSNKT